MKIQNPQLRQALAAEYVLGTLHGRARRRFQRLQKHDAALGAEVRYWERRLAGLSLRVQSVTPREVVWAAIDQHINQNKVVPIGPAEAAPRRSNLWRNWAALSTAASLLLGFGLWQEMRKPPEVVTRIETVRVEVPVPVPMPYVALLQPAKSEARWKVSIYPDKGLIKISTSGRYALDEKTKSLELWVVAADGPHSLGLLPVTGDGEMPMPPGLKLEGEATLAVSLEPYGGSPTGKPTGPVLLVASAVRPA